VETLTPEQFDDLIASGTILEQTERFGPKVLKLEGGEFVKFFRIKSLFSKYWFISPAKRFASNAKRLENMGIPVLKVKQCYRVPHLKLSAVRYQGLEGTPVRELLQEGELEDDVLNKLVCFIAVLHEKGVYFRSLHFGNIILTPEGELGLIDFLDCYFKRRLFSSQRKRNFAHLFRYKETKPYQGAISDKYFDLIQKK